MKRTTVWILVFVILMLVSGVIAYYSKAANQSQTTCTYQGYLSCQMCALSGMSSDRINLFKHPEEHTLNCMQMPACAKSGYGIFVKNQKGDYSFIKFDEKSSTLAYRNIICKTSRPNNLLVDVTGKMKNGLLAVECISEE